ncbi:unconventional myosin-IXAa-like [Salvelinus sp. IW2-2015]|uniref:unconventional myosin-IXAa-like n=1 Tax=Salvelinus sp. IW2-2015 TaxID=2691554 RepID=UPI0038D43F19
MTVKEEMLFEALTTRKTVTVGERLIVPYKLAEAGTVRDSMAKSLYSALFDWIVFRTNHALLNNKDLEHSAKILSIGVLDIFGFEDYENNSFEQFCINLANERLHHYFNQHLFKLEQEEYRAEGISWHNIDYIDNTGCINLISKKPTALLHLLDEECNFPQASNQTLLDKFKRQHEGNSYIEFPAVMEPAFIICHYAGKVKYGIKDFREKNTDHMRPDIVALLKSSKNAFICGLMGIDPVATFRWAVLRTYFRAMVAFREAGKRHADKKTAHSLSSRDGYGVGCNGRRSRQGGLSSSGSEFDDGIFFNSTSSKLLERAQSILMRNKNYKSKPSLPKHLLDVKSLRYLSSVTLHDRITKSLLLLHKKKKTPSISAQFQASLNKLMETLGQSEPYFVKCVRSNAEKSLPAPPPGSLSVLQVFLRDAERQRLQALLHKEVLGRIVTLQRRFRARLERKHFINMRQAADVIQRTVERALEGEESGVERLACSGQSRQQWTQPSGGAGTSWTPAFRRMDPARDRGAGEAVDAAVDRSRPGGGSSGTMLVDAEPDEESAAWTQRPGGGADWTPAGPGGRQRVDPSLSRRRLSGPSCSRGGSSGRQPSPREEAAVDQPSRRRAGSGPAFAGRKGSSGTQRPGWTAAWGPTPYEEQQVDRKPSRRQQDQRPETQPRSQEEARSWTQPSRRDSAALEKEEKNCALHTGLLAAITVRRQPLAASSRREAHYRRRLVAVSCTEQHGRGLHARLSWNDHQHHRGPTPPLGSPIGHGSIELLDTSVDRRGRREGHKDIPNRLAMLTQSGRRQLPPMLTAPIKEVVTRAHNEHFVHPPEDKAAVVERLPAQTVGGSSGPSRPGGGSSGPSRGPSRPGGGSSGPSRGPSRPGGGSRWTQPSRRRQQWTQAVQEEAQWTQPFQEEAAVDPAVQEEAAVDPAVQEEAAVDPAVQEEAAVDPAVQEEAAVCLQASWRGYRQCRQFLQWRDSALIIQRRWRNCCQHRALAAITVQTAWRVYRARAHYRRRRGAVMLLQAACRGYMARLRFTELKEQEKQLLNGQSSPTTEEEKADRTTGLDTDISEDHVVEITHDHGIQDVSTVWPTEDSKESRWKCLVEEEEDRESERRPCIEESSRQSIEPSSHKTRAKRQNRRMRELEQTQFSLELLKVRTHRTGGTLPEEETHVPPCPDSISCPLDDHQHHRPYSPHLGSPDSHGSIELLDTSVDVEVEAGGPGYPGCHVNQSVPLRTSSQEDSVRPGPPIHTPTESQSQEHPEVVKQNDLSPRTEELPPMLLPPIKEVVTEATRATFYIPPEDQSSEPKPKQQSPNKRVKERRESASRRPVVVVISMQKETLLDEGELRAAKAQESALQMGVTAATFSPTAIAGLEVSEKAQPSRTVTKPPRDLAGVDMSSLVPSSNSSHGLCPSEVDIQIVLEPKAPAGEVPPSQQERKADRPAQDNWVSTDRILESREAALASQKKTQTVIVNMTEKSPTNITFSPRRKLPFSKSDKDLVNQEWSLASVSRATVGQTTREVCRPDPKKKARMSRTRSDFLTRCNSEGAGQSDDDETFYTPVLSCTLPLLSQPSEGDAQPVCHTVSEMATHKEVQKSIHKTMSSGDLGKVAALRKTSSQDGSRVRGKIRFWGKTKHAEKKLSRDKQQSTQRDGTDKIAMVYQTVYHRCDNIRNNVSPHSPNLMGTRGRETKENKEPSPKVRRRRSVKISQRGPRARPVGNDALHILTSTHDYRSMNDFLMKEVVCRYACHRKCCTRMTTKCSKKYDLELSSRQFGVEVSRLTSEERTVPLVVEKLINYIEMHGLYTEGIFRKSGSTNKIKELRQGLDTDVSSMNLDDYNIHVIAGVLKQWLRDLPNPLMTFELYEEFLRAMGQPDKKEVIRGVYSVIDLLSRTHLSTLERLIFHLVRIALQEDTNRMSANALAIVFAPCILRCPDTIDPLQSVQDIGKTTACVELIIGEQMNKYRARLKDINSLEFAENKAKSRLTHIRKSMKPVLIAVKFIGITRTTTPGKGRLRRGSSHHTPSPPLSPRVLPVVDGESAEEERAEPGLTEQQQATMQQEERVLTEQIESLQREKEELTYEMLILDPRASDDETLESEASTGTADSSEKLYMDPEGAASNPSGTYHSRKSEAKSRRCLRRQPDSVDSTASSSIIHQSPNYRFRSSSSGPLLSSGSLGLGAPLVESEGDPSGTVGVKSRHRLRLSRSSPREAPEGHRRESDFSSLPQQLVLYGSNEFMV